MKGHVASHPVEAFDVINENSSFYIANLER